jgi:hypothetical protein
MLISKISRTPNTVYQAFIGKLKDIQKLIGVKGAGIQDVWFNDDHNSMWEVGDSEIRRALITIYIRDELISNCDCLDGYKLIMKK